MDSRVYPVLPHLLLISSSLHDPFSVLRSVLGISTFVLASKRREKPSLDHLLHWLFHPGFFVTFFLNRCDITVSGQRGVTSTWTWSDPCPRVNCTLLANQSVTIPYAYNEKRLIGIKSDRTKCVLKKINYKRGARLSLLSLCQ